VPGNLYVDDARLGRAYAEGLNAAADAINPHPAGTLEADAWDYGSGVSAVESFERAVEVSQKPVPTADWTKTQLKAWLDEHSIDYAPDVSKAELQALAGVN